MKASKDLKIILEREITLMREILSNLREEENALMRSDRATWDQVMMARSDMIASLNSLRTKRQEATKILQEARPHTKPLQEVSMDQLVSLEDELSVELYSLLDQLMALMDRLNLQNSRNDHLFDQTKKLGEAPLYCPVPQYQPVTARRRVRVATKQDKKRK